MPKQKVELELCVPLGYEATGEYRAPRKGEWIIDIFNPARAEMTNNSAAAGNYIILRKRS